ncbi:hypothetical protein DF213_17890 [Dickeya dianthicola]|uniref:Lipoprotein n=1 Tax=Dickeya dianthicola TaxID=204039 RepID=A0AAX1C2J2_9GAMM|nr:hypothetical protein DF213_17890 [Dickeya dianthicola]
MLSCFMLCGCGTLSQVTMPAHYRAYLTHSSFPANVDDIVHHYMKDKSVSGISIAVIHNRGPAQFYCYGVTDEQSRYQTFAQINQGYARHGNQVQNIAWVTDADGKNSITYQVGYIGGYSSFIGFDKQHGNAIVVLQNAFNWSNYLGIALLTDLAERR